MLISVESVVDTGAAVAFALMFMVRFLRRSRPDLRVGTPLAVGFILRVIVIAAVSMTGIGTTLRGGDETTFLREAHIIAPLSWTSGQWLPTAHTSYLHVLMFAAQIKVLGSSQGALRITQIGISLAGALLIAAAVYDLVGARPARLTAWLLSLEPASLFFNELLHKEPLMELASGLVVFGGVKVWARLEYKGMAIMGIGGLIALGTRVYVGWFLLACAAVMIVHAALRQLGGRLRSLPIIYGAVAVFIIAIPVLLQASSPQSLQANLQTSQNANTAPGTAVGNNLALEKVNFSTRSAILTNLPRRISDVLLRPYPWQVGDTSQVLGVVGSVVALFSFYFLLRFGWLCRRQALRRAGPLLYPFFFLLIAYALSVGNAGTGFRYRTQLVTLVIGAMVILRATVLDSRASHSRAGTRSEHVQRPPATSQGGEPHDRSLPAF